jgi:hypothetical protein
MMGSSEISARCHLTSGAFRLIHKGDDGMKKNRVLFLFLIVAMLAFTVTPVFAQGEEPPAGPVTMPVDLEGLIQLGLIFLVTAGLKSLSSKLGKDLTGWAAMIAASLTSAVILFFNALLSAVPEPAQASVAVALTLLVTILGAFGVHGTVKVFQSAKR